MQFNPDLAEKIKRGQKWETRRIVQPGDWAESVLEVITSDIRITSGEPPTIGSIQKRNYIKAVYRNYKLKWQIEKTYAVQPGRGKLAICYFPLAHLRKEHLLDINRDGAKAEGFTSIREFLERWDAINGPDATNTLVWVLTWDPKKVTTQPF
jgi:hypothetical protein